MVVSSSVRRRPGTTTGGITALVATGWGVIAAFADPLTSQQEQAVTAFVAVVGSLLAGLVGDRAASAKPAVAAGTGPTAVPPHHPGDGDGDGGGPDVPMPPQRDED